jgi:predicted DNA binding protein
MVQVARKTLELEEVFIDGSSAVATMSICSCSDPNSTDNIAHACICWIIPPTTFYQGWEHYRLFSPDKASLQKFVHRVEKSREVELLSHKGREDLDLILDIGITPVHLFEGLSDRQLRVLTSAYEAGLLDVPSKVEMDQVAEREGISRSAYGEHLRKSLRQIVHNLYPLLRSFQIKGKG